MKKRNILLVLLLFLTLGLVSCDSTKKMPKYNSKKAVELSQTEYVEKVNSLTVDEKNNYSFYNELKGKTEDGEFELVQELILSEDNFSGEYSFNGEDYNDKDNNLKYDFNVYLKDNSMYLDSSEEIVKGTDTKKVKFEVGGIYDNLFQGLTDVSEIDFLSFLKEDGIKSLVDIESDILTFYQDDEKFTIKLEINKENLESLANEVKDELDDYFEFDLTSTMKDFNYLYIINFENNKFSEYGVSFSYIDSSDQSFSLKSIYRTTSKEVKSPKNTDDYKDIKDTLEDLF